MAHPVIPAPIMAMSAFLFIFNPWYHLFLDTLQLYIYQFKKKQIIGIILFG